MHISQLTMKQAMAESCDTIQSDEFPESRHEFFLRGPAGKLECVSDVPEPADERPATMVICHPHPEHGGTMHNKVVTIMERSMRELGLRTIRFNFRAAGESEGDHDDGYGETDDLFAVTEWVRRTRPNDDLWLGGFSFGSFIAMRAAQNLKLGQLITNAPPVDRYEFSQLQHPQCPWLVVQGDEDEVVCLEDVACWLEKVDPAPEFLIMEQAGHFFHRRLMDLRGLLKNGVRPNLPEKISP